MEVEMEMGVYGKRGGGRVGSGIWDVGLKSGETTPVIITPKSNSRKLS